MQIKMALRENAKSFPVTNPTLAMTSAKEICGGTLEQMLGIIVENLISAKKFNEAKKLFDDFCKSRGSVTIIPNDLVSVKKRIRNEEIAYMVLKLINMNGREEEEKRCWQLIKEGVRMGNVNLSSISLGTSSDGSKRITLEDIWPDEEELSRLNWSAGKSR